MDPKIIVLREAEAFYKKELNNIFLEEDFKEHNILRLINLQLLQFYDFKLKTLFLEDIISRLNRSLQDHLDEMHNGVSSPECDLERNIEKLIFNITQNKDLISLPVIASSNNDTKTTEKINRLPVLRWKGSDADLLELAVALTKTEKVVNAEGKPVRAELITALEILFGKEIKHPDAKISQTRNRKKTKAPFLSSLVEAYNRYLETLE